MAKGPCGKHLVAALFGAAAALSSSAADPSGTTASAPVRRPAQIDTPASEQGKRFLRAVIIGDDASFLRVVHEIYPTSKLTPAEWLDIRPNWNRLQFHGIERATVTQADLSVFDGARDGWALVSITVQPNPPYAITGFDLRNGRRPADVPAPAKLLPEQLIAATRAMVRAEVAADRFSGAMLIAQRDRVRLAAAYGLADRETRTPNTLATQFRFGSVGKLFTAVAIMQLAQARKLDLTAPIGGYLHDYPNPEIAAKVTINQLLTHSGATGDIFGPEFDAHRDTLRTPKDYIALYGGRAPLFPPGTRQAYSNYGFIILGRIVETVSGLSYADYIQRNIFAPARMSSSGFEPEDVKLPNRAVAYLSIKGVLRPVSAESILRFRAIHGDGYMEYRGGPAGGGYSTVGDFLRFAHALLSNRLLDAEHFRQLTAGRVALANGVLAGYDFGGGLPDGRRFIGHGGSAPGQNAEFRIYPHGYIVVVLANRDAPIASHIMNFIGDRLP